MSFARLVFRLIQVTAGCYIRFVHNILEGLLEVLDVSLYTVFYIVF